MKIITAILTIVAACLWAGGIGAETLVIPGTGACEAALKGLAAAFNDQNPGHEVIIPLSIGSGRAIKLAGADEAMLGRIARPLKEKETGFGLKYLVFARDAVIFAVGNKVTITGLTVTQLSDIFSGKITDWQEVGGDRGIIRVIIREPGDGSLLVIQKHFEPFKNLTFDPKSKMVFRDHDMPELLGKYHNAIGWLTNSTITESPIKALAVDQVFPTPANLREGRYKLLVDYALVYKEKRLSKLARRFIEFIFSDAGKAVLSKYGLIPVNLS
ncbi:MAG: substrate-binding domain-containing protein [Deltaproteobacteria bacterium]|nr:substrate-binding domain-containing protein [Deltaproteobacteria bacterium]